MSRTIRIYIMLSLICSIAGCTSQPCDSSKDPFREDIFSQDEHVLIIRFYPPQGISIDKINAVVSTNGASLTCIDPMDTLSMVSKPCYFVKFLSNTCYVDASSQLSDWFKFSNRSIALPRPENLCDCDPYWEYPLAYTR